MKPRSRPQVRRSGAAPARNAGAPARYEVPDLLPNIAEAAGNIARDLRRMKDPARARAAGQYFKHEIKALGITAPALRGFIRERAKELRRVYRLQEAIQLCDLLLAEEEIEIRAAGFLFLAAFKKDFAPELLLPQTDLWLGSRLDNWALVDGFCGCVLSPLLGRCPEVEGFLNQWSKEASLWQRRAALVTLVPFAGRGLRLNLAYRLCSEHLGDKEDLMHKATGWLLREAGKTDRPRLRAFLLEHGPRIPRTALRYAIEHFPPSDRARLLKATR